jgi:sporulation integral membrane protein YlbJ
MKKKILDVTIALVIFFIIILMVTFPSQAYNAAKDGLTIWFHNVLPSLLPFFIGTEILIGLGVVHFIGVLLEPIMYPLFKVPGVGSFAYAMSITSGYPMGSKITTELRNRNLCSREEGQRLLAFCSTSGPLFMIGAVAIGMFGNPLLGVIIAISHYIGSILTGVCFRHYGKNNENIYISKYKNPFKAMLQAKKEDGRKFGVLFGDAVKNSFNTLLVIGGFIMFFSVLTELFSIIKFFDLFTLLFSPISSVFSPSDNLMKGLISGIMEITNGAEIISKSSDSLLLQGTFVSFIIAWGGLSIHAQAISFISKTDLKISPYIIAKALHGVLTGIVAFIFIKWPFPFFKSITKQVFYNYESTLFFNIDWLDKLLLSIGFYCKIIIFLIITSILLFILYKIKKSMQKKHANN